MNARTAVAAVAVLGYTVIIAVHAEVWGHFSESLDYLERTFACAERAHQLIVPVLGEIFSV
ncbi:hypothetical protein [Nocardia fluminea]|uniref:hypothetical protein n=1 Tax=Nocardia fluminea TaxID=134984 RepID=UPI003D0A065A